MYNTRHKTKSILIRNYLCLIGEKKINEMFSPMKTEMLLLLFFIGEKFFFSPTKNKRWFFSHINFSSTTLLAEYTFKLQLWLGSERRRMPRLLVKPRMCKWIFCTVKGMCVYVYNSYILIASLSGLPKYSLQGFRCAFQKYHIKSKASRLAHHKIKLMVRRKIFQNLRT